MRNGKDKFLIDYTTIAYVVNGLEQYDGMLDNRVRILFLSLCQPPSQPECGKSDISKHQVN